MLNIYKNTTDVLRSIKYMNIASITPAGEPWNSPVYYAHDKNMNFYWHSWKENQHSVNIENNPQVFVTVYDSTVREGSGFGVYFQGTAKAIIEPKELAYGLLHLYGRTGDKARAIKFFLNNFPRRVYRFTPQKVWVNGDGELKKEFIDIRQELNLDHLKRELRTE